jgi:hypothetical protein
MIEFFFKILFINSFILYLLWNAPTLAFVASIIHLYKYYHKKYTTCGFVLLEVLP